MKTIFKFRFWDTTSKKMIQWDDVDAVEMCNDKLWYNSGEYRLLGNVIPMQWISLTDKNGKEIYDKDFIKDEQDRVWQVMFNRHYAGFVYSMVNLPKKKFDGRIGVPSTRCQKYLMELCTVIGNVYETPELLKTKQ